MTDVLTSEEIEAFRRDGAVLLKSALPDEWVGVVRDGLDHAIASPDALSADLGSLRAHDGRSLRGEVFPWTRRQLIPDV